jgi:hypothetical protein
MTALMVSCGLTRFCWANIGKVLATRAAVTRSVLILFMVIFGCGS